MSPFQKSKRYQVKEGWSFLVVKITVETLEVKDDTGFYRIISRKLMEEDFDAGRIKEIKETL